MFKNMDSVPAKMVIFTAFLVFAAIAYNMCITSARADGRECDDVSDSNHRKYCIGVTTNDASWCNDIRNDRILKRLCKTYSNR